MTEAYIVDWLNLIGRWVHMITGIAWIGASFYFVWLDDHLQSPKDSRDAESGIGGEVWAVHGGGFYRAQKYRLAPPFLPETLHWFKWEAYWTWISGVFLLALIYWYSAEIYLIDPSVAEIGKPVAVGVGVASLVVGWLIYDGLCKSPLGKNDTWLGIAVFVFTVIAAWGLCQVFSGRGAYIHYGAMLGTIMVANVFFVIIPGQRELVTAKGEGRDPDPTPGLHGKQRSVHNTYFTLPVLFVMVSNHYASTYGHSHNWLVLVAISLAGALIRVYFVQRHSGKASPVSMATAVVLLLAVVVAVAPRSSSTTPVAAKSSAADTFEQVQAVVKDRCVSCHAASPTQAGFTAPPKGVVFDTAEQILNQAVQIHQQTVVSKVMPVGNLTQMTDDERALLDEWFKAGAKPQ